MASMPRSSSPVEAGELPSCITGLGLNCYTTAETPALQGKIKHRSGDFIVTELDEGGQLVALTGTTSALQTETTVEVPLRGEGPHNGCQMSPPSHDGTITSHSTTNESSSAISCVESPPPVGEEPVEDHKTPDQTTSPHLSELVTNDVYQQLVSMAAASCSATPSTESAVAVNLGVVEEKAERAGLHRAVRLAFPLLSTATHTTGSGEREIHVAMDTNYPRLRNLLGHDEACRLLKFLSTDCKSGCGLLLNPDPSKEHRTEVHRALGELYGQMVTTHAHTSSSSSSPATPPPAKKARSGGGADGWSRQISVQFRSRTRRRQRVEGDGKALEVFTKFVLRKEKLETLEAVSMLARAVGCHASQLAYAGCKDTRAITTQCMTIRGVPPSQMAAVGPLPHLYIGNFQSVHRHIHLGEHGGNHFKIRIRNFGPREPLDPQLTLEGVVGECVKSLEEKGFANYFGPQRFGYRTTPRGVMSPCIGLAMLQGNHMKAVDLLLCPQGDSDPVQAAKQYFTATHDAVGCLQRMPGHMTRECLVLKALRCHGYSDYGCTRALCSIPYNSRLLYLHSFSSLLWNHLASFRVSEYGMEPVEGDLVLRPDQTDSTTLRDAVHVLTAADIQSGQYSVTDVVLPTVGTATVLPGNTMAQKLLELLSAVGLALKSFRLRRLGISSSGAYRKLLAFPQNMQWRVSEGGEGEVGEGEGEGVRDLEMEFSLPPSCYATVLLRELMKTEQ